MGFYLYSRGFTGLRTLALLILTVSNVFLILDLYNGTRMDDTSNLKYFIQTPDASPYWQQLIDDYEEAKRFIKVFDLSVGTDRKFDCLNMLTHPPTPICVHDVKKDEHITAALLKDKTWEGPILEEVQSDLMKNDSMGFIDLGANIGVYSLVIAKMGRDVVAVEPYKENILRFQRAAQLAGTTNRITLLQNGLSDRRGNAELRLSGNNQGDTRIAMETHPCTTPNCPPSLKTILLSDLRYVVTFKQAIMKIDIQGHELEAFATIESLLNTIIIPVIYMEWHMMWHAKFTNLRNKKVLRMIQVLRNRGYVPYQTRASGGWPMRNFTEYQHWSPDIVWRYEALK